MTDATLANLRLLLYNGYYCFEAMTERDLDEVICGICGVIGEVYLGDGNEKNCCSNKNVRTYFVVWICWYYIGWNKAFYNVNALL